MGFLLAHPTHDEQIRALLRLCAMPGAIRLAFCREPDYFAGESIFGPVCQTLVYESEDSVQAIGCRSIKPSFVNADEKMVGYLHGLRIARSARNGIILGRGYKALRDLHADGRTPAYLTTIVSANIIARRLLTSRKAGMPFYRDIGEYHSYAIFLGRTGAHDRCRADIVCGDSVAVADIVRFLQTNGRRRQYFPCYQKQDFNTPRSRGFSSKDFLVATDNSKIKGVCGVWDQGAFRQTVIAGYSGTFAALRPFVNAGLRAAGFRALPAPGRELACAIASFVSIARDDPAILENLLAVAVSVFRHRGFFGISIGFHESDPLRMVMKKFRSLSYTSRMYLVSWDDGRSFCDRCINERVPYLELGAL